MIRYDYLLTDHDLKSYISLMLLFNSQARVAPELAQRGVFRFSRLSVNGNAKTVKKYGTGPWRRGPVGENRYFYSSATMSRL